MSDFSTGSELIVTIAWRSAQVAALASALMLAIALVVRARLRRRQRLRDRVVAAWRPLLARIALADGEPTGVRRPHRRELPYVMEEWNALHDALRGDATERLNALAPLLGFAVAARRGLRSGNVRVRVLSIRTLGHLHDPSDWKPLQEQLVSDNALVSFYAAAALVSIDAPRAMPGIMLQLAERESWPGEAMARLLVDAGIDVAREPVRALILSLAPDKTPPLLHLLAHVDAMFGNDMAVELLRRHPGHHGIVAAVLRVALDPALLADLARYADSPDASVRESLARACGRLGGLSEVALLVRLMSDRVWWVRYYAAQALLRLKDMDGTRLAAVRQGLTDPYASDMLKQVCAEAAAP